MGDKPDADSQQKKRDITYVEERFHFARREWPVQKAGMALIVLFLAAGVLGLFSNGLLSDQQSDGNLFTVEYQQFLREDTSSEIIIRVNEATDTTRISLSRDYIENVRVEQVVPEPQSVKSGNDKLTYTLYTGTSATVILYIIPQRSGVRELQLEVNGDVETINQFTYI